MGYNIDPPRRRLDIDEPANQISLAGNSSIDGEFSTTVPIPMEMSSYTSTLSAGLHNVTVTATDSPTTTTATLSITINTPPTAPNLQ